MATTSNDILSPNTGSFSPTSWNPTRSPLRSPSHDVLDLSEGDPPNPFASANFRHGSTSSLEIPASASHSSPHSTDDSDTGSDESDPEAERLHNKRMKKLQKMYPPGWIKQHLGDDGRRKKASSPKKRAGFGIENSASRAKTRRGHIWTGQILGDSESEDDSRLTPPASDHVSHAMVDTSPISLPIPSSSRTLVNKAKPWHPSADTSDSEVSMSSENDDEPVYQAELDGWIKNFRGSSTSSTSGVHHYAAMPNRAALPREGDLIDRMLCGVRRSTTARRHSTRKDRKASGRPSRSMRSHDSSARSRRDRNVSAAQALAPSDGRIPPPEHSVYAQHPRLDIATRGAGHGMKRQANLKAMLTGVNGHGHRSYQGPPSKMNRESSSNPSNIHVVRDDALERGKDKKKRKRRLPYQGQLYIVPGHERPARYVFDAVVNPDRPYVADRIQVPDNAFLRAISVNPERVRPPEATIDLNRPREVVRKLARVPSARTARKQPGTTSDLTAHEDITIPDSFLPLVSPIRTTSPYHIEHHIRHFKTDCGVAPLPRFARFDPATYLAKGRLSGLLAIIENSSSSLPEPVWTQDELDFHKPSANRFLLSMELLVHKLANFLESPNLHDETSIRHMDSATQAACIALSWVVAKAEEEECSTIATGLSQHVEYLTAIIDTPDAVRTSRTLSVPSVLVSWFVTELVLRTEASPHLHGFNSNQVTETLYTLLKRLITHDLGPFFEGMQDRAARAGRLEEDLQAEFDDLILDVRVFEIWVCLIHASSTRSTIHGEPSWLETSLVRLMKHEQEILTEPQACERHWRLIYQMCALSRVSKTGLVTSESPAFITRAWSLPLLAVKPINFTASSEEMDKQRYTTIQVARDAFLKVIVSRFFLLLHVWNWRVDKPVDVLQRIGEIFRSRWYSDFQNEDKGRSFPPFLQDGDPTLATIPSHDDTGFWVYLKFFIKAVESVHQTSPQASISKIISISRPSRVIDLKADSHPTDREIRTVYNRIAWAAASIMADPSNQNADGSIRHIRTTIRFENAHRDVRGICLSGLERIAVLLHKKGLDISPVLEWAAGIADTLIDEAEGTTDSQVESTNGLFLKAVLRALSHILKVRHSVAGAERPSPLFLTGSWMRRVLPRQSTVRLSKTLQVGVEVRELILDFLTLRDCAIARAVELRQSEESQESQDWGFGGVDYSDLAQELNEVEGVVQRDHNQEDQQIAEVCCFIIESLHDLTLRKILSDVVLYALYYFTCRCAAPEDHVDLVGELEDLDRWVDCWTRCAWIVQQVRSTTEVCTLPSRVRQSAD
jgi:hypothetical protein